MASKSVTLGAILIVLGAIVSFASDSNSITSWIPAFIGVLFVVLGLIGTVKPDLNHHVMHGAAALSLLSILASLGSLLGRGSSGWALFSQLALVALCAGFLVLAIQSFKAARLARESAAGGLAT